jgi:cell cycle sensor histidine kinase DivJ
MDKAVVAHIDRRALGAAAGWHALWAAALGAWALIAGFDADAGRWPPLLLAAAPGLVGQVLRAPGGGGTMAKVLTGLAWPLGVGAAIALGGGLTGPFAVLAIAPAAAMATLGDRRFVALGAAVSAATVAVIALLTGAGLIASLPGSAPWQPLAMLAICAVGFAAALQIMGARNAAGEGADSKAVEGLKALLDASPLLMLRLDGDGRVREAFGGAPEDWSRDLVGQPFETLASEAHRHAAGRAIEIARLTGASSVGFPPPNAPDRFLAVEIRALPGGAFAALVRDAAYERAYEAYLEQARAEAEGAAQAKSRFLASMSHELRTPLNAIIGFSDIMRGSLFGPLSERYAEYAGLIHESGGHLLDLINDILDISKIEADRFTLTLESFDAREAVAGALRLTRVQADTAKISLRGALPREAVPVTADRRAIKQIVLNLISNALKFTPAGGQVNVLARARGRDLEIIVADTGVGIAPQDLERLGRPYEQAGGAEQRALGTGLGLSLVRAFAEMHGGSMTIKSLLGEGTAVTVRLPVLDLEAKPPAHESPAPPLPAQRAAPAGGASGGPAAYRGDNVVAFRPYR